MNALPKGWVNTTVGEIVNIVSGKTPKGVADYVKNSGEIPWVKVSDMNTQGNEEFVYASAISFSRKECEKLGLPILPAGSVIFPKNGGAIATGKRRVLGKECSIDLNTMGLTHVSVHPRLLYYWTNQLDMSALSDGSVVPQINKSDIAPINFYLPPANEQTRIAEKLDNLFTRSRAARQELTAVPRLIERYKQAILFAAFGGVYSKKWDVQDQKKWKSIKLENCGEWAGGGTPSKSNPLFWANGNIPWVSPKDMKTFQIEKSEDFITKAAVENSPTKILPAGTILMVTRSGILKHSFPVAVTKVEATINQDLKAIIPNSDIDPEFLAYCLISNEQKILDECCKDGTTVDSISTDQLKRFEISIPKDKKDQRKIVQRIEKAFAAIDAIAAQTVAGLHQLSHLEAQCLNKAFRGELVPQDPNDEPASALLERLRTESSLVPTKKKGTKNRA